jgi:hypothetical protein
LGREINARSTAIGEISANGFAQQGIADALAEIRSIPGASAVTRYDPRLGSLLRAAVPDAPNVAAALITFERGKLPPAACKNLQGMSKANRTMARAKLEDEVLAIMSAGCNERDRDVIAACLKWRGKRRPTYGSVGKQFGLTHERARQVSCRWLKTWAKEPPFAPTLDRALAIVQAASPNFAGEVEKQLAAAKLSREPLSLERLHNLAALIGRKPSFVIFGSGSPRSVASEQDARLIVQLQRRARKIVLNGGLASVRELNGPPLATPAPTRCITHALRCLPDFAWLAKAEGVFTLLRPSRNKLWTRIRKVLAVAPKVHLDVLWKAVTRDIRFPRHVTASQLLEFCRLHPACRVVGRTVIARDPGSPLDILQGDERRLVGYLIEHGTLSRQELFQLAKKSGIGVPSFDRCLRSPAVTRYAQCLYGLTGTVHAAPKRSRGKPQGG